jgi:hypothetical protein
MLSHEDLAAALLRQPFEPFRICLSDGKTYDVKHPDLVWIAKRYLLVASPMRERELGPLIERYDTVALLHVVRLESLETAA